MGDTFFLPRVFATRAGDDILSIQAHQLSDRRRYESIFRRIQQESLNDDGIWRRWVTLSAQVIDEETIENLYLVSIVYVGGFPAVVDEFDGIDRLENLS